ncbi:hypothetical protein [Roseibium sp. RKSG952]|uniref:hypothetical protein n=1 Tax=Roseibium sp. RKSG952 TaxID=2529384 RepID=UPI0012BD5E99|nr:hypothetical protein [Roseibium sp. RKSG952]MTH99773.1 hypothetical protein [Roseibium sp. RKSG952]
MPDPNNSFFPYTLSAVAEDMQARFGWQPQDLNKAMAQLLPAAQSGFDFFGGKAPNPWAPWMAGSGADNPFASMFGATSKTETDELAFFYGPEPVRSAVAEHIAKITGLQQDAIQEVMPVAASLAMAKLVRPYLPGQGQEMLDAFMRGFARGRPKPAPTPMDMMQDYGQAVQAFWQGFLQPFFTPAQSPGSDAGEPDVYDNEANGTEAAAADDIETDVDPERQDAHVDERSEFEDIVADWMNAGRSLQSSQFEAFDEFFANASRDLKSGET